nr:endonuclease/exonuclease/phosphatase family protein [Chryseolinea lacunae]
MKYWILNQDADIQCYQEFMTFNGEQNFDMLKLLTDKGYHCYLSTDRKKPNEPTVGVLIASRFPIVKSGDVAASENGFNRIAYADVLVQHDTVRIISLHLESMGLRQYNPAKAWSIGSAVAKVGLILNQLEAGMNERNRQIKRLTSFIRASPHRVVCTGDFNDLPYAFPYQALKKQLHNTFEEAGRGFGFTYNGSTLRTLRIDNQFYSPGLTPTTFNTLNTVTLSDHFPLLGTYTLTERR